MSTFSYSSAVSVDKGLVRNNNEDNFYFNGKFLTANNRDHSNTLTSISSENIQIYGVFDGMGGEALGEEASYIAAHTISKAHKRILASDLDVKETILNAVEDSNTKICKKILESGEKRIGATFSAISIKDDIATVYNVGDSRVYLLRDNTLKQISVDDTSAQRLVHLGVITPEEAKTHKDRHKLTQHLGIFRDEMTIEPHISEDIKLQKNDKLLMCSDGLTDMLDDEEILDILSKKKDSENLSRDLLNAALDNGGVDNVTVLVISVGAKQKTSAKKKHKILFPALLLLFIALAVVAVSVITKPKIQETVPEQIIATNIYFANPVEEISVGTENTFLVAVEPPKAEGKVVFTSSDESVISIDGKTGFYKALQQGNATITASNGTVSCDLNITVFIPVQRIETPEQITLSVGDKETIKYSIEPVEANAKATFWIDNESVATISEDGVIEAKNSGVANIIITIGDCENKVMLKVTNKSNNNPASKPQNSGREIINSAGAKETDNAKNTSSGNATSKEIKENDNKAGNTTSDTSSNKDVNTKTEYAPPVADDSSVNGKFQ